MTEKYGYLANIGANFGLTFGGGDYVRNCVYFSTNLEAKRIL